MKKLLLLFTSISLLAVTSCSIEDVLDVKEAINEGTLTSETVPLIGNWQLKSAVLGNGIDVTNDCFMEETIEFKIDGTYIDRRNQINETTGACEMVGEFIRGYNPQGEIFETEENELLIATYELSESNNKVVLSFIIPFEANVTYKRIGF